MSLPALAQRQTRRRAPRTNVITLERTACFGACPIYNLTIFSDGTVQYVGTRFVKKLGSATGRISRRKLRGLIREFDRIDYFNLDDDYTPGSRACPHAPTDMPSAITSFTRKGNTKTIRHYHGCHEESLTALENKIDQVVNTKRWTK